MDKYFLRLLGDTITAPLLPLKRGLYSLYDLQHRERIRLSAEIAQMRGLMPLLMKQRNGCRWTAEDKLILKQQLRKLLSLSPYLILVVSPGGFFALPILAWWLDRRRQKRIGGTHHPLPK